MNILSYALHLGYNQVQEYLGYNQVQEYLGYNQVQEYLGCFASSALAPWTKYDNTLVLGQQTKLNIYDADHPTSF